MITAFCQEQGIRLERNVPLREHTTFRIGGPADYVVYPSDTAQMGKLIVYLKTHEIPYFLMGRGSDILAADEGFRGVIVMTRDMNRLTREGNRIFADAGCSMAAVSNFAQKEGLGGLEFLHGIPGSIGGGVYMNAGAYGSEISAYLQSVEWVDEEGFVHTSNPSELDFSYRHSYFSDHKGVVCSTVFYCPSKDPAEIRSVITDLDSRRREKQPLEYPSAGSAFKRPEGYFAGKLIEDAGLKGYAVGGACVSEKHAGFIVNKGGATAADVKELICRVAETVDQKFGVRLESEIQFLES